MKIKFFLIAALAVCSATFFDSCTNEEVAAPQSKTATDGRILFNITHNGVLSSRGTATTPDNFNTQIEDFQVLAYYSNGDGKYVGAAATPAAGIVIDGDGTGNWNYHNASELQYWPAGNLDFQAVTPSADASFTLANTPAEGSPRLTANVTVPTNVTDQKDIMFAAATGINNAESGEPVGLTFQHALSQVVFSGKVANPTITAVVSEITVCNVNAQGNVGYRASLTTLSAVATEGTESNFSVGLIEGADAAATTTARTITTTEPQNLTNLNGALMMIPQSHAAWTHEAPEKAIADATGSYLKVKCTVSDNNSGTVLIDDDYVYIPFDLTTVPWELGKKYTYTLVFGNGSGGYDEEGNPLTSMVPITYTVESAAEWTAVDGGTIEF